jgi:hypothetical protein
MLLCSCGLPATLQKSKRPPARSTVGLHLNEGYIPSLIPLGSAAMRYELVASRARRSAFNRSKLARKASSAALRSRIACSASRRRFSAFAARSSAEVAGFSRCSKGCMQINASGEPKFPDARASLIPLHHRQDILPFKPVGPLIFAMHTRTALTAHLSPMHTLDVSRRPIPNRSTEGISGRSRVRRTQQAKLLANGGR